MFSNEGHDHAGGRYAPHSLSATRKPDSELATNHSELAIMSMKAVERPVGRLSLALPLLLSWSNMIASSLSFIASSLSFLASSPLIVGHSAPRRRPKQRNARRGDTKRTLAGTPDEL